MHNRDRESTLLIPQETTFMSSLPMISFVIIGRKIIARDEQPFVSLANTRSGTLITRNVFCYRTFIKIPRRRDD